MKRTYPAWAATWVPYVPPEAPGLSAPRLRGPYEQLQYINRHKCLNRVELCYDLGGKHAAVQLVASY